MRWFKMLKLFKNIDKSMREIEFDLKRFQMRIPPAQAYKLVLNQQLSEAELQIYVNTLQEKSLILLEYFINTD